MDEKGREWGSLEEQEKKVTVVSDATSKLGDVVTVRGWVYRNRSSSDNAFVVVRDGTGIIQTVVSRSDVSSSSWKNATEVYNESVVLVTGKVVKDERSPTGVEIKVQYFETLYRGDPFPIGKGRSVEFLLDHRHLWVRSQSIINALKVKATLVRLCREFLDERGFLEIQPPLLTRSACEGGSTLFEVEYFGGKANLSQSGQLYSEAVIAGYPLVYVFSPSFRAEPSRTPRHLTEFWQLEPEMAFYNQKMNMKLQGELVEEFCHGIAKKHSSILPKFKRDPKDLLNVSAPFEKLTYEKAIKVLHDKGVSIKWGYGIGLDEEKLLVEDYDQPVFLMNLPKELRPFYMKINPDDPRTVLDADLLAPEGIGEIIGGSERVSDYKELVARMKEDNLDQNEYSWYLDLRRFGTVPHSGFGMGSERVVRWILKLNTIRDTIPFPRTMNRIAP